MMVKMTAEILWPEGGTLRAFRKFLGSNQMASWAGQGLVSAVNFVVLIVLARSAGATELGYYAIGFSILVMAMVAQDSLVTRPYAIQMFKQPEGPAAHAFGALTFGFILSLLMSVGIAACGTLMLVLNFGSEFSGPIMVIGAIVPLVLTRDFARRFCFANLRMREALALDAGASLLQLFCLATFAWQGMLGASTALASIGVAGAISAGCWLTLNRRAFRRAAGAAGKAARQSWSLGKWLISSQLFLQLQGYAVHWITLIVAGAAATGIYVACLSIVGLSNPFLFGLFNALTPQFVRTLKDQGEYGLRRAAFRGARVIGAVMGAFALLLGLGGGLLMSYLYPGLDFTGGSQVLILLASSAAVAALGAPATIALSALERGRAMAALSLAICCAGAVTVWILLLEWGLVGAAIGILATEVLGTLARWSLFLLGGRSPPVSKVQEQRP